MVNTIKENESVFTKKIELSKRAKELYKSIDRLGFAQFLQIHQSNSIKDFPLVKDKDTIRTFCI